MHKQIPDWLDGFPTTKLLKTGTLLGSVQLRQFEEEGPSHDVQYFRLQLSVIMINYRKPNEGNVLEVILIVAVELEWVNKSST